MKNSGSGGLLLLFWKSREPPGADIVRNRKRTPSSSRTNLGPSFFFSALHWPITRMRRLLDDEGGGGCDDDDDDDDEVVVGGIS